MSSSDESCWLHDSVVEAARVEGRSAAVRSVPQPMEVAQPCVVSIDAGVPSTRGLQARSRGLARRFCLSSQQSSAVFHAVDRE